MKKSWKRFMLAALLTANVSLVFYPGQITYAYELQAQALASNVPAEKIGLPTRGAEIKSVEFIEADAPGNSNGAYYKVLGAIRPVDVNAPAINFQLNLPLHWNQKLVQFGGGAFDGFLVTADTVTVGEGKEMKTPLSQGYATFGSDSGHVGTNPWDSSFAVNDEALRNFAHGQLKKTKDAVLAITSDFYGQKPKQVYFIGGSNGGREALQVVQRYPEDYDGVVALYPVLNWVPKALHDNVSGTLMTSRDGWLSSDDFAAMKKVVYEEGDGLDGVVDGVIANAAGLEKRKDKVFARMRKIISPAKMNTLESFYREEKFNVPLANGFRLMAGYMLSQHIAGEGLPQFSSAPDKRDGSMQQFSDGVIKYQIMRDGAFKADNFSLEKYKDKVQAASQLLDATNPQLDKFYRRGGKLMILHGTADQVVSLQGSIDYYERVKKAMGAEKVHEFVRFYTVPGYGHGFGTVFNMGRDLLGDIDAWVTQGKAPRELLITAQNKENAGRTLNLVEYPAYPRYKGSGDVRQAASFASSLEVSK